MDITIQAASPDQAAELSVIALSAKGYWGYSSVQLEHWRTEFLTISPEYITANRVWVAYADTPQPVGFAAIEQHGEAVVLEHLWVRPDYIGKGVGRRLFLHVAANIPRFVFTSDPHADDFYYRMGARKIGEYESGLQKRMLTVFEYTSKEGQYSLVRLRPLQLPDDWPGLQSLDTSFVTDRIYQVQPTEHSFTLVETPVTPIHKTLLFADELLASEAEWDHAIVAERESTIAGFVAIQLQSWNRRASLLHLYVNPRQRGHGIGAALMNQALDYARARNSHCLWLEVTNINYPAIQFYKRMGFQLCGLDTKLYDPAGDAAGEIALFFARDLAGE